MKKIIGLMLLIMSFSNAEIAIEPWGTSYHWDRDKKYNEDNKYIGLVYRKEKFELGVATFENSFNRRSNVVYVGYKQKIIKHVSAYADVGYVTGYKYKALGAVGLYFEYKDVYLKTSINHKYVGFTLGFVIKGTK